MTTRESGAIWGRDPHPLLAVEAVWERIAGGVEPLGTVEVPLRDAAGHVLAAPVAAGGDYPGFDKAMMDGFAVRSTDCAEPGAELRVVGLAVAGSPPSLPVVEGQAMRINTGAPVPPGADAVVMVEKTESAADGKMVRILTATRPEQNIERQGSIRRKGDAVLTPPVRLGPARIAAAATAGVGMLTVFRRPGVGVVVTGSELVPPGEARTIGQVYDSNGPMLFALMQQFGALPRPALHAMDTLDGLKKRFSEALTEPILLAVGGMSMGTLDLVPQALAQLGVRWELHGVSIRPGKPMAYGRGPAGQHVFGLPGNPASAFVCAWAFVRMVVEGLQGLSPTPPPRLRATVTREMKPGRDPRPAFVPARAWTDAARGLMVEPCPWRGSSDPFGLTEANALLLRPASREPIAAGESVELIFIGPDLQ